MGNPTEGQRLIQYAVMEPAMTTLSYDYQAVLFEEVPLLENHGATIERVNIPIDPATRAITVTDTGVYTQAQQMQVTFHMREDLYWSDGQPLKASDSVFGFNVACTPGASTVDYGRCVKVERYEAVGNRRVRVTFKPDVMELDYFTYYWPFIPEHAWSRYTPEEMATVDEVSRRLSPSYGPYMVDEWIPGESISLVRNPHYVLHGEGFPVVNRITFRFLPDAHTLLAQLLSGRIDLVDRHGLQGLDLEMLLSLEAEGLLRVYPQASRIWEHIDMNLNDPTDLSQPHPLFGDPRVRQVIAYGTNREAMAREIYSGQVSVMHSWIPAEHWAYAGDDALTLYPYDPERAAELLEEAGWILADDGYRYKDGARLPDVRFYIPADQPYRERIAQLFQADMQALGIAVDIVQVPEGQWYGPDNPRTRRAFDLIEFAWIPGLEPNGQVSYTCENIPSEDNGWRGQNFMGWCDSQASVALLGAAQQIDREQRTVLYQMAQERFTADIPSLPLFSQLELYAAAPGLRKLGFNPTELMTWNCWEWHLPIRRP
jgi:peptide/nickel transport system substrate-binding protein